MSRRNLDTNLTVALLFRQFPRMNAFCNSLRITAPPHLSAGKAVHFWWSKLLRIVVRFRLAFILVSVLSGCSSMIENESVHRPRPFHHAWVQVAPAAQTDASERVVDRSHATELDYQPARIGKKAYLGIIEFTDQGMLKEQKQFTGTNGFIEQRLNEGPLALVIFVHGWNHNASPQDKNLRDFREMLLKLRPLTPQGNILGVYLGWPGNMKMLPFLSYFSRLGAAERVGRLTCTEVMLSLVAHAKTTKDGDKLVTRQDVKTIVIGHSMGGLIVERSFLQAMIGYVLTNAATSDQIDALRSTEKQAIAYLVKEQDKSAETCAQKYAAREEVRQTLQDSETALSNFIEKSKSLEVALNGCVQNLGKIAPDLVALNKEVEQWHTKLETLKKSSVSEQQKAAKILDPAILHEEENSDDSIHHILEGLTAWARAPQATVDGHPESPFRKDAETYLIELDTFLNNPLRPGLSQAIAILDAGAPNDGIWRERIIRIVGSGGDEKSVAKMFREAWKAYEQAKGALADSRSTAEFTKLKRDYDTAGKLFNQLTGEIQVAEAEEESSRRASREVAKLDDKLDLGRERPPADLILLMNPASDALAAEQMQEFWRDRGTAMLGKAWQDSKPWIVSVSSNADRATGMIYPVAMAMARLFKGVARPNEESLMTHTAPHVQGMQTHALYRLPAKGKIKGHLDMYDLRKYKHMTPTPLWIVSADKQTVPRHNVSTEDFVELVPFLLRHAKVFVPSAAERKAPATQ
jgi:hypothetical protein